MANVAGARSTVVRLGRPVVGAVSRIGSEASDPVELRLRKLLLVGVSLMVLPASIIWGAIYWAAGERGAALLPWLYAVGSIASLALFHLTRRFDILRLTELGLVLVVPFLLTVALGGIEPSSGVILWSFLAPVGAIAFDGPRAARWWFVAYGVLLVIAEPLASAVRPVPAALPEALILTFVALNIGAVSLVAFVLLSTFARQREEAQLRADGLLLNILPPEIAERLKVDRNRIAEQFDATSILFADVVGFTPMSAKPGAGGRREYARRTLLGARRDRRSKRVREDQDDRRLLHGRGRRPPAADPTTPRRSRPPRSRSAT